MEQVIEEILIDELRLAREQIEFGYLNKSAEDVASGTGDLKALSAFLSKCHEQGLLLGVDG